MSFSITEENYIKAIFHLQQAEGNVSTNELAAELHTKAASVTDMLKKLKAKKLLSYEKYKGVRLSNEGKKLALAIVRKHRLWEYFLVDKLQFGWDEVHEVAEELEHISSKKLVEKLDAFLGYPKFDPHGDPIPDSHGKMAVQVQVNLIDLPVNRLAEVSGVGSQSTELLELLKHKHIGIGTRLEIKRKFSFDHSIEIKIRNQNPFTISQQLAQALFVKPV
ncbi:MAG: metal-dependent transcriptional regulator [Chitinophagaceae bacterium]|nr:metal-dependent transcriptional regulator [Chitinophagaceae bacterium]MCA6453540.1 metal-dependent transcriptional regulator [Chitinophagaceae bacterium]MCA6456838.1 metal-dependent transcriptional regulator [Chitinophagaceae bacterium]MCA6457589.1 metal-dependent transcriptional regulator [Chitinophagaceae bacterium]MCA6463302.1 metal-dependent transcriptional regulator [Chitinophagaceae bacterium]